jgi:hypothetical protein
VCIITWREVAQDRDGWRRVNVQALTYPSRIGELQKKKKKKKKKTFKVRISLSLQTKLDQP